MSATPNQLQAQWLISLQSGCELAFENIYRNFWSRLYSVAYNHLRDRQVAEELVQDLFTSLWLKRHQLVVHSSLQAYLLKAIRNDIYDYIEKQAVRQRVHDILKKSTTTYSTDEEVAYQDLQAHLSKAVEMLPEPAQKIFRMSRFDHLPVQEIAEKLNLSPKTVEYHLTRALRLLRLHLKEFFLLLLMINDM